MFHSSIIRQEVLSKCRYERKIKIEEEENGDEGVSQIDDTSRLFISGDTKEIDTVTRDSLQRPLINSTAPISPTNALPVYVKYENRLKSTKSRLSFFLLTNLFSLMMQHTFFVTRCFTSVRASILHSMTRLDLKLKMARTKEKIFEEKRITRVSSVKYGSC